MQFRYVWNSNLYFTFVYTFGEIRIVTIPFFLISLRWETTVAQVTINGSAINNLNAIYQSIK